jgi:hypothetical protein
VLAVSSTKPLGHIVSGPKATTVSGASGFTVIVFDTSQPPDVELKVIISVPAEIPVSIPVAEPIEPIEVALLLQVPDTPPAL